MPAPVLEARAEPESGACACDATRSVAESMPAEVSVVLAALEHLSGERDHEQLPLTMMRILGDIGGARQVVLHLPVGNQQAPAWIIESGREPRYADADEPWPVDVSTLEVATRHLSDGSANAGSVVLGEALVAHGLFGPKGLTGLVTMRFADAASLRPWWIGSFLKVYRNHVNLINDAECDTLTGLFNRKTFEERIDRVLAMQRTARENPSYGASDRRVMRAGKHHWLAVIDFDHFKSVNDCFGHLYGDEILILVSRLMMRGFRMEDRLFRFGGEEFVNVLSPCSSAGAAMVLDRFRTAIANYAFPQVGKVAISIGYTRIRIDDLPSIVVGRADQALYYAKRNGRDQVRNFEQLAAAGETQVAAAVECHAAVF